MIWCSSVDDLETGIETQFFAEDLAETSARAKRLRLPT